MGIVGGLLPLLVIAAIIAAIISATSRTGERGEGDAPEVSPKQVFFYLFSFAALMVLAGGASVLISYMVDSLRGGQLVGPSDNQLALGLALTIVGAPAWALTWRHILKSAEAEPGQRSTDVRGLYIYVIETVSVIFIAVSLVSLVNTVLGAESLSGTDIAWPVTWGLIWGYHWWLESQLSDAERAATPFRSIYIYLLSMVSLVMLLVGAVSVIDTLIDRAYVNLFMEGGLVRSPSLWDDAVKNGIAVGVVGGLGWWWHWFHAADQRSDVLLRQAYIYIFGVLTGFIIILVTLSIALVLVLQWLLSAPGIEPAVDHFRTLTTLIPVLLAGVMLWTYHAEVMRHEAEGEARASAIRVHDYIVAGLGLATLATGFIFVIALFISASARGSRDFYIGQSGWQGQLAVVITLLLVGGGTWAYYWLKVQRNARAVPADLESEARKLHIYAVFGISALAALASLSTALYMLLQGILDSDLSTDTLRDAQWAIAVLVTTGVVSGYYFMVMREDRRLLGERAPAQVAERTKKQVTVLVREFEQGLVAELESRLGYSVNVWLQPDAGMPPPVSPDAPETPDGPETPAQDATAGAGAPPASQPDSRLDAALAAIDGSPTDRVLVIIDGTQVDVRPYRRE